MICTTVTGSWRNWNSIAPQRAEKANPARLESKEAANTAAVVSCAAIGSSKAKTTPV